LLLPLKNSLLRMLMLIWNRQK